MRGGSGLFDRKQRPLTGKTQPFPFGDVFFSRNYLKPSGSRGFSRDPLAFNSLKRRATMYDACHRTRGQVCMVRMQSDARLPAAERLGYKHIGDALFRIAKEEGVRTYWRGATPTGRTKRGQKKRTAVFHISVSLARAKRQ